MKPPTTPALIARRADAHGRGKLLGFEVAAVIERAAALGEEAAKIRFDPTGTVTLLVGTHSHGQGHETVFRQLLCGELGVPFDAVRFVQGDTDAVLHGTGTFGSRSSGLAGVAIVRCAAKIIDKGRRIAATRWRPRRTTSNSPTAGLSSPGPTVASASRRFASSRIRRRRFLLAWNRD